jgi:hypothetical protein
LGLDIKIDPKKFPDNYKAQAMVTETITKVLNMVNNESDS